MLGLPHWKSGLQPPPAGPGPASRENRPWALTRLSDLEEHSVSLQMEKDETVSDCSPHIANIGRLVEVSGPPAATVRLHRMGRSPLEPGCQPPLLLPRSSAAASSAFLMFCPGLVFPESSDLDASRAQLQRHPLYCPPNTCTLKTQLGRS